MYDLVTHTISQGLQAFLPIAFCLPWFSRAGDRDAVAGVKWGLVTAVPLTAAGAYWLPASMRQSLWEAALAGVAFALALWFARSMTRGIPDVPSARGAALARLVVAIGAGTLVARQTMEIAIVSEAAADGVAVLESEIVGLVPADALPPDPVKRLKLREADVDCVLEKRWPV